MKSSDRQRAVEPTFSKKRKGKSERETGNGKPASSAGRPNRLDAKAYDDLMRAYYSRPYSFRELADMFGVSRMTVWRAVQEAAPVGVRL